MCLLLAVCSHCLLDVLQGFAILLLLRPRPQIRRILAHEGTSFAVTVAGGGGGRSKGDKRILQTHVAAISSTFLLYTILVLEWTDVGL